MKWLGRSSPFHLFTNPCVIKSVYFWSRGGYLLYIERAVSIRNKIPNARHILSARNGILILIRARDVDA